MGYARIRPDLIESGALKGWEDASLCDLEGNELYWKPEKEWVEAICFDGMATGLYVLTDDGGDAYFTCHSIDLEFKDTLPTEKKEKRMAKHALPYNIHRDIEQADFNALVRQLGQDLDTWQMIARDLARDIRIGDNDNHDSLRFALDVLSRLSHLPEMNIHPSERA